MDILDTVGEGEGEMIWENNIETYTLSYAKDKTVGVRWMMQGTQSQCSMTT